MGSIGSLVGGALGGATGIPGGSAIGSALGGSLFGGGGGSSGGGGGSGAYQAGIQQAIQYQESSLSDQLALGREALDLQREQFNKAMTMGAPYRESGNRALSYMESMMYGVPVDQTAAYIETYSGRQSAGAVEDTGAAGPYSSKEDFRTELASAWITEKNRNHPRFAQTSTAALAYDPQTGRIGSAASAKDNSMNYLDLGVSRSGQSGRESIDMGAFNAAVDKAWANMGGGEVEQGPPPVTSVGGVATYEEGSEALAGYGDVTQEFDWQKTPSYEFRLAEGQKAIERSAAASSGLVSGRQMKALERYGQDMATMEFDNILNRLGGLVNTGAKLSGMGGNQAVQSGVAQAGTLQSMAGNTAATAGNVSTLLTGAGSARESSYLSQQQAGGGGFQGMLSGISGALQGFGGITTPPIYQQGYGGTFGSGGGNYSDIIWN